MQVTLTDSNESRLTAIAKESKKLYKVTGLANMMIETWLNNATNKAALQFTCADAQERVPIGIMSGLPGKTFKMMQQETTRCADNIGSKKQAKAVMRKTISEIVKSSK